MAIPEKPETRSTLNPNTVSKFNEALRITAKNPDAASRLVLADTIHELQSQVFVNGTDLATQINYLMKAMSGKPVQ